MEGPPPSGCGLLEQMLPSTYPDGSCPAPPRPSGYLDQDMPQSGSPFSGSQEGPHLPEGRWLELVLPLALCSSLFLHRHFSSVPGVQVTNRLFP